MENPKLFVPVKTDVFHILLVLLDGPRHGYGIMRDVAEESEGQVRMLPGALYRHLHRMLEDGIVEEVHEAPLKAGGGNSRRRCYAISDLGRRVAEAEATRLARLVWRASAKKLVKMGNL